MESNLCLGLVTDSALRHIDNAAQTHRVIWVIHNAQVRHEISNLAALIEACSAHHLVGNA